MSVSCSRCGKSWPRDPRLEVRCPTCQAPIGVKCRRPSGHDVMGQPHIPREELAVKEGFLSRHCPGNKNKNKEPDGYQNSQGTGTR